MQLGNVLCPGQEGGHGAEGLAGEIHIEPGYDDAHAGQGEALRYIANAMIEELGLVYAHYIHTHCEGGNGGRAGHGHTGKARGIVRDDVGGIVTGVGLGLEAACLFAGYLHALEPAYELFALAGEHAAANDLYPAGALCMIWFYEHDFL